MAARSILLLIIAFSCLTLVKISRGQESWEYCGNKPADVAFLLDSSNSIWGPDFRRQIVFVEDVVSMFQIGENSTRVGVVTYNDHVNLQFNLKRYFKKDSLLRAIRNVRESHGYSTATDSAIKYARTYMFSQQGGGRPGVAKVAIVITDGKSRNTLRTLIEASRAKRSDIHLFAIGVGHAINHRELSRMASQPASDYFFQVAGYSALDSLKKILAIKTCQVSNPPTFQTTTPVLSDDDIDYMMTSPESTTTTDTATTMMLPIITSPSTTSTPLPITTTTTSTTTKITSTTTTTPMSTTTTWVDIVRKECKGKLLDVVFALDNSDAVTHDDFWQMIRFVRDFARGLDIHQNGTRIGVILYSEKIQQGFGLDEHDNLYGLVSHLYKLQMSKGDAKPDEMLRYVRTKSFRRSVSRKGAAQVVIVLTASSSPKIFRTKQQAMRARKSGLTFLAIGVGSKVREEELWVIAGPGSEPEVDNVKILPPSSSLSSLDKEADMMMDELMGDGKQSAADDGLQLGGLLNPLDPLVPTNTLKPPASRSSVFRLDRFSELESILLDIVLQTCAVEPTDNPVADQPCGTRQEADVMFVVDSANAGQKNTKKAMDFLKSIAGEMEINEDNVQLGLVAPDPCLPQENQPPHSFSLKQHPNKENLVNSLQTETDDSGSFTRLVRDLRKNGFGRKAGGRKAAKRVAVLIVDGNLEDPLATLTEAQRIRDKKGVEIYVISVGTQTPQPEMMMMCDYPTQKHFYHVDSYDRLGEMKETLLDALCDDL